MINIRIQAQPKSQLILTITRPGGILENTFSRAEMDRVIGALSKARVSILLLVPNGDLELPVPESPQNH